MTTLNDEHNATYVSGLLFHARIAMLDAKANNGYACFDLKSLKLLVELQEAINRSVEEVRISINNCPVS